MAVLGYRKATEADLAFVVDSWVSSYRTAHAAGLIPMDQYGDVYGRAVRSVLDRPGVEVWVAYCPDEPDHRADLYGWVAVEAGAEEIKRAYEDGKRCEVRVAAGCPLVHYVFVKVAHRRQGLAKGLLKAAGVDLKERFLYSCKTGVVSKVSSAMPKGEWHPLIARFPKH